MANDDSDIKELRQLLGVTQLELAAYLRMNASTLAMAESDEGRWLRSTAFFKFIELQKLAKEAPPVEAVSNSYGIKTGLRELETYLRKTRAALTSAQRKLEKMQQKYAQAENMRRVIAALKLTLPGGKEGADDLRWCKVHEEHAIETARIYNAEAQSTLQVKIAALEHAIALAEAKKVELAGMGGK